MGARRLENLLMNGYADAKTMCPTLGPESAQAWLHEHAPEPDGDPYRAGWAHALNDRSG